MLTRSKAKLASTPQNSKTTQSDTFCDGNCSKSVSQKLPKATKTSKTLSKAELKQPVQSTLPHSELPKVTESHGQFSQHNNTNLSPGFNFSENLVADSDVFEIEQHFSDLEQHHTLTMNVEDIAKLLSDHSKQLATQWDQQLSALSKVVHDSHLTPKFPSGNGAPIPKFSGTPSEDVTEFLANFSRAARFYQLSEERKSETLPLYLTGNANIWFNTTPGMNGKSFEELSAAMKAQFHSESDVWLLRQKLNERRQLSTESVSEFAAQIRQLSNRINLPRAECINYFIQGLRPELKNFVLLRQPTSFEQAESLAKLKQSVPDKRPEDRTDEVLKALAALKQPIEPRDKSTIAAFDNYAQPDRPPRESRPVTREEIGQIVAQQVSQEMRRQRNQPFNNPNQRGRRTFAGRPICDYCNKPGHVAAVCRQRQNQRDPRIPFSAGAGQPNQPWRRAPPTPQSGNQQHLN